MTYRDEAGRPVEITGIEFIIGEGVYVTEAFYEDDQSDCSEETLAYLENKYQEELYTAAYEDRCAAAYDSYKDAYKYGDS